MFKSLIESLDLEVSLPNILKEIIDLKITSVKFKLSSAFASQSTDNVAEINSLLEEWTELNDGLLTEEVTDNKYTVVRAPTVSEIFDNSKAENRIQIYPKVLTEALGGGVLRGHHIVFFGRPEIGKTTFLLNMCYGFLKQGLTVLYVGNEDPANDIFERFLWRLSGLGAEESKKDPERVAKIVAQRNYDKFIFCDVDDGTLNGIRCLIEEYRPDVLIVDQARNLSFKDASNRVLNLETGARGIRGFGKRYNLVPISTYQAGESADGRLLLNMGDLDYSNTGVQGTADLMIGFGANEEYIRSGRRMLSLCRNKISGKKFPIPVKIDPLRSLVE